MVDCVKLCFGCNGGNQTFAFRYLKTSAIEDEATYPYKAVDQACAYSEAKSLGIKVQSIVEDTQSSAPALKQALAGGPVAVSIEADTYYFQAYTSGILDNAAKCGTSLDHAVLAVGWGVENGVEYWIVKNSWNTTWGDQGYIRFAIIDGDGICGVQMGPVYPVL